MQQPVPFSHRHHAGELGIDCRYCHTSVEKSSFAGLPPTQTCMTCHSQIWTNAAMLEPVRASYRTDKSLAWTRVNALPDFVYFDHSIHVAKGDWLHHLPRADRGDAADVPRRARFTCPGASTAIGSRKNTSGRNRKCSILSTSRLGQSDWSSGGKLVKEYKIQSLQHCSTCHR